MEMIKNIRKAYGVSQRRLAARAHVSFRGIQLLEEPGHNWRINTLSRVVNALGRPGAAVEWVVEHLLDAPVDSIRDISLRMALEGFDSWKTHFFNFVDAFRRTHDEALIHDPPVHELDERLQALTASGVEALCSEAGIQVPPWCAGIPSLKSPWYPAGIENLKAMALIESPVWFRRRNIFVLGNFLDRV